MSEPVPTPQLVRGITRPHLAALAVNCVVGAGILGLPSKVYALLGGWSLPGWLIAAAVAGAIAACLAEVGSRFAETGGAYLYARHAFGPGVGFLTGWLSVVSRILGFASVCNLFVSYAGAVAPGLAGGAGRAGLVAGVVGGLCALLGFGIRHTAWAGSVATALKIGLLGTVVGCGLAFAPAVPPILQAPAPDLSAFGEAALLMLFAFAGFEAAAIPGGEVRDPKRDLPVALGIALAAITAIYVAVQYACIALVPDLATSERPLADLAMAALGPPAGTALAVGAMAMLTGTMLTQLLGTSRLLYAMSANGELPGVLAAIHPTRGTPLAAIAAVGAAGGLATLASTFVGAVAVTVSTRVLTYAVICLAVPVLRRRDSAQPASIRLPFGDAIAGFGFLASAGLLFAASRAELGMTAALGGAGLVIRQLRSRPLSQRG